MNIPKKSLSQKEIKPFAHVELCQRTEAILHNSSLAISLICTSVNPLMTICPLIVLILEWSVSGKLTRQRLFEIFTASFSSFMLEKFGRMHQEAKNILSLWNSLWLTFVDNVLLAEFSAFRTSCARILSRSCCYTFRSSSNRKECPKRA